LIINVAGQIAIAVSSNVLESQLVAEFPPLEASMITAFAAGFDAVLMRDAFVSALLSTHTFEAIAALYASSLRVMNEVIDDGGNDEKAKQFARQTRERVEKIVRLGSAPRPQPVDTIDDLVKAAVDENVA